MLEESLVEINLTSRNIKRYESLNYDIPKHQDIHGRTTVKIGTHIIVRVEDVPKKTASVKIKVKCDYCGKIYNPLVADYYKGRTIIQKDACLECSSEKNKESKIKKYGTNSMVTIADINGTKLGRKKINFSIIKQAFLDKGLVLQIDEDEYINVTTPIPFICNNHKETGIQYKTYDSLKIAKHCCDFGAIISNSGENSSLWRGGTSSKRDKVSQSPEYKTWRTEVYKHDNYTCQCCGDSTGGNLSAHHKENFSSNEGLRLDVDNGITLCDSCHNPNKYGSFHNVYGTYNNTPEQLEEYIHRYKLGDFEELKLKNII